MWASWHLPSTTMRPPTECTQKELIASVLWKVCRFGAEHQHINIPFGFGIWKDQTTRTQKRARFCFNSKCTPFWNPLSSWWFQPSWKICSSNWIISPGFGAKINNYFTSSDPHHDMLGGGCQARVVIENIMGRMENLRRLISGFLGLVILVRWALVTMFLSWTTQTGCRIHRTYVSLIGSGEGRHTTHLLKCVPLLSTSQTDWKQSSDVLSDISFDILSDISSDIFFWYIFWHSFWHIFWHSFWHLSDISFDILSDKSFDTLSDISFDMLSDISSDILSDISKPKPNIHSFTQKAALQTLYLPHTTQQK